MGDGGNDIREGRLWVRVEAFPRTRGYTMVCRKSVKDQGYNKLLKYTVTVRMSCAKKKWLDGSVCQILTFK